jgi:hypothetical protein
LHNAGYQNVQLNWRGGRFQPNTATLKLELFLPSQSGELPEVAHFKAIAALYNFSPSDLGRKFTLLGNDNVTYTLTGARNSRSEYKFRCVRDRDKKGFLVKGNSIRFVNAAPQPRSGQEAMQVTSNDVGSVASVLGSLD